MGLIRDDILAAARRWRELIAAGIVALAGLWLMWLGGYLLFPVGAVILVLCALWGVQTWRRLRFSQDQGAPGMVEVDEGQVGYLGPAFGGFVALPDLVELRILTLQGQRLWRLKQSDGQALLIPVSAAGADRLFDAFASLPGIDSQALVAAAGGKAGDGVIWRRGRGTGDVRLAGN
ncbi:MAG: hypothetical protein INF92_19340 [Rhodobacter sp.]|nr:hypothetical protein [Rhodobacter sp.]